MFDIIFSGSKTTTSIEEEKYKKIGNFFVNSNTTNSSSNISTNHTTFDMLFRSSAIFGVDFIDILFYDTTAITQIEKEKANTEVESRKQYLSIVSDKFMTPIQVLLLSINNIAKVFKDQNKALPKDFEEIQNLGIYIQVMNQDITCVSRMECGLDVNFESFKTAELFNFSKEIIDIESPKSYGRVVDTSTKNWILSDSFVSSLSQEHGIVQCTDIDFEKYKIGDLIDIIPVHSCLTANLMKENTVII